MTTETKPAQTDDVVQAIEAVLAAPEPAPDPWWRAGIEELRDE